MAELTPVAQTVDLQKNAPSATFDAAGEADDGISLLDLLIILAQGKKTLLLWTSVAAVLAIIGSFFITVTFLASTRIMPPQQQQGAASMLASQLGSLAGLAGGAGGLLKNPNDLYVAMLKSNSIVDRMIDRFKLMQVYESKFLADARKELLTNSIISAGKDGMMLIEVIDEDPQRAADMANAYVAELIALTKRLAITEAQQRRLFFEKQLGQAKDNLANAEQALKVFQEKSGLIKLDEQAKGVVEGVAKVRAEIAAREVQVSVMRSYATEQNPQFKLAMEELSGLRVQLAKLESRAPAGVAAKDGLFLASGKIPEAGLEYLRKIRDLKYHETIFELMAKQFEIARIDESRDGAVIQVVDLAQAPERKHGPKRSLIVLLTTMCAFFVALLWVFIRKALSNAVADPSSAARLAELKLALAWKKSG